MVWKGSGSNSAVLRKAKRPMFRRAACRRRRRTMKEEKKGINCRSVKSIIFSLVLLKCRRDDAPEGWMPRVNSKLEMQHHERIHLKENTAAIIDPCLSRTVMSAFIVFWRQDSAVASRLNLEMSFFLRDQIFRMMIPANKRCSAEHQAQERKSANDSYRVSCLDGRME